MQCYLFDVDGTVANLSHRLHFIEGVRKDWQGFFAACDDDAPVPHVCLLAKQLMDAVPVLFVSGRSEQVRLNTLIWLDTHVGFVPTACLYMRREGDHRPDNLVKSELLDEILAAGYEPIMAFDDRDQVVKMWRERGIPCAQVAEGAF